MKIAVIIVLVLSIALGIAFWRFGSQTGPKEEGDITLTYWGVFDEEETLRPAIDNYQATHPKVKINYVKQNLTNYRTRVQTQLQAGQGPDIFRIHSSWVPMFAQDLSIASDGVITFDNFKNIYYPVAVDTLTSNNKIYALPLEIDGLALFYNEDILKAANVSVPTDWASFMDGARKMTVKNSAGQIETSGASIGATTNVDYWPEIISLLFYQQPNGNLLKPNNQDGADVLQFYTSFITDPKSKTWDVTMPSSFSSFTQGKSAYYFGTYKQIQAIKSANPNLKFKVVAVPQLYGKQIALGSFWAEVVSARSKHQEAAWEFLKYLSSPQALQIIYQNQTQKALYGKPFPRTDMANLISDDPYLGAFVLQGPYYKSWYLNSGTGDAGLNDEMINLFSGAVNNALQNGNSISALNGIAGQIQPMIDKYTKPAVKTK